MLKPNSGSTERSDSSVSMESSPARFLVLPRRSELSGRQIGFLDETFKESEDMEVARVLWSQLSSECSDLDDRLLNLRKNLMKCAVSWISRSYSARSAMQNLSTSLEDLSLCTSSCGAGSMALDKRLKEELSQLAKELCRIQNIRKYVDITLKLEALVGDLEDNVIHAPINRGGSMFRANLRTPSRQERFGNAIKAMNEIEQTLSSVSKLQPHWNRILNSVDARVDKAFSVLRPQVDADHRALLSSLGWPPKLTTSKDENAEASGIPNPLVLMERDKKEAYSQSFLFLCALQDIQMRREVRQSNLSKRKKIRLCPIDELVQPVASRMEHHFIKWAGQPELIFALVYKVVRDFSDGVDDVLQPLIDKAGLVSYSAKEAWISAMVQMLSGFLTKWVFPELVGRYKDKDSKSKVVSSWLHLVAHMVAFDKKMKSLVSSETYLFMEDSEMFGELPEGISVMAIFCEKPQWLKIWTKIELKDACRKLKEELKEEKVWTIDTNAVGVCPQTDAASENFILSTREEHKAPIAAEFTLKITWKFIEQCLTLPSVLPRVQFVRSTATRFIWYFLKLVLFQFKKTDFSVDNSDEINLVRVCRLINAARYVETRLQEWSDYLYVVEMKLAETALKDGSCFFDEEVKGLVELETNCLMEIITVLLRQFENLSCDYFQYGGVYWENGVSNSNSTNVSHLFAEALDVLRAQLRILQINLNSKDFLDLWRNLAEGLDHFIIYNVFSCETCFPKSWINQFGKDAEAVFLVFQPLCTRPAAFFPRVRETLKLLNMSEEEIKPLRRHVLYDRKDSVGLSSVGISHLSNQQVEKLSRTYRS